MSLRNWQRLLALAVRFHSGLEFWAEMPNEALNGPSSRVAERTNRVALDLLCELPNHVDLRRLRFALDKAPHDLVEPIAALAARRALEKMRARDKSGDRSPPLAHLTATLVFVEEREARNALDNVGLLVHNDDRRSAEATFCLYELKSVC